MTEQWRQQMQQKLADYRQPAPELSWDEIDQALDARRSRSYWAKRLAAAAVALLLMGGAGYWALNTDKPTVQPPAPLALDSPKQPDQPKPEQPKQSDKATKLLLPQPTVATAERPRKQAPQTAEPSVQAVPEAQVAAVPTETVATPATEAAAQLTVTVQRPAPSVVTRPKVVYPAELNRPSAKQSNRLVAQVYMSNAMTDYRRRGYNHYGFYKDYIHTETKPIYHSPTDLSEGVADGYKYSIPGNVIPGGNVEYVEVSDTTRILETMQIRHQLHHRPPLRFGFSLRYAVSDRWSIESGLSYTRLSSEAETKVFGMTVNDEQTLKYFGVPLNVGYQLWNNRHFNVYVLAGGTVEKMYDASPWQFSLNAAAGAEYRFSRQFSLYAEPGLGYYFDDNSSFQTIYHEHPLNLTLSLGLRLNLSRGDK